MIKFGIYYIPQKSKFYDLGSKLVGYDIRETKATDKVEGFNSVWNKNAREYGFHITLTDAVYIEESELANIESHLQDTLGLLASGNRYKLTVEEKPVTFWRTGGDQVALRFKPDSSTLMLHTLLVCKIQVRGNGSLYSKMLDKNLLDLRSDMTNKVKTFWSPYVLDEFRPHFTLINPYDGSEQQDIENRLNEMFVDIKTIDIDSLCLVTQDGVGQPFKIYKEFKL